MQAGVQGAWGVIPVHLNELAADAARGLMPGLAYQMGILLASPTNSIEYALRDHVGYQRALAGFEIVTIVTLAVSAVVRVGRARPQFRPRPRASSKSHLSSHGLRLARKLGSTGCRTLRF